MRHALTVLLLTIPLSAQADESGAVKELLDKASKAQGEADKVAKLGDLFIKGKAKITEGGQTGDLTFDLSMRGLDFIRGELEITKDGRTEKATLILAKDKAWVRDSNRDKVEDAPEEVRGAMFAVFAAMRAPGMPGVLVGQKDFTLTHGGEAKVDDTPVDVLRIARKDRPDVTVYFDKKTGHPIKSESQIMGPGGEEKTFIFRFSDVKEAGGVKHFHKIKIIVGDMELVEVEFTEVKPGATFEASTFEKP